MFLLPWVRKFGETESPINTFRRSHWSQDVDVTQWNCMALAAHLNIMLLQPSVIGEKDKIPCLCPRHKMCKRYVHRIFFFFQTHCCCVIRHNFVWCIRKSGRCKNKRSVLYWTFVQIMKLVGVGGKIYTLISQYFAWQYCIGLTTSNVNVLLHSFLT